jgi:hypothetical protein
MFLVLAVAAVLVLAGCSSAPHPPTKSAGAPVASQQASSEPSAREEPAIPPYFKSAAAALPYPALYPPSYFRDEPLVARAYQAAREHPGVVAQQPCYCHCDKFGHRSLLDCYASDHGAG